VAGRPDRLAAAAAGRRAGPAERGAPGPPARGAATS